MRLPPRLVVHKKYLPGDVEVAFRLLGISVAAAAGGVGIRHDRRHDERIV